MGRKNQNAFIKKQKEEKKRKAREAKRKKMDERKQGEHSGKLEDMIAYVDEFGNITSEPPEEKKDKNEKEEDQK